MSVYIPPLPLRLHNVEKGNCIFNLQRCISGELSIHDYWCEKVTS